MTKSEWLDWVFMGGLSWMVLPSADGKSFKAAYVGRMCFVQRFRRKERIL